MSRPAARRICAAALAWLTASTASLSVAHAASATAPADSSDDTAPDAAAPTPAADPNAEAQRLYDEGRVLFETADYDGAVARWTEAYAEVPDTPESARIKALLIYNIATGRERTFDVTQDVAQLRKAKILLEGFARDIPRLYPSEEQAAEQTRVAERIAALQARIEAAEPAPDDAPPPSSPPPSTEPNGADTPPSNAGRVPIIIGAVALGLGVAGLGVMGAGLGIGAKANDLDGVDPFDIDGRRDQFDRGRTGNALAIAGGAMAGVFVVTGAVLVAVGVRKNRRVALTPGPGLVGAGLRWRI